MKIEIKNILKQLLKERDLSVAKLGRATGIPPQTLNNWLAGQEPRSLIQIKTVANYFHVSVDYLVYGTHCQNTFEQSPVTHFQEEINAGVFEVILRRVKNEKS